MAQETNVDKLRAAHMKMQAELIKEWEETLDENGTFAFVFGDPSQTPCTFFFAIKLFLLPIGSVFEQF